MAREYNVWLVDTAKDNFGESKMYGPYPKRVANLLLRAGVEPKNILGWTEKAKRGDKRASE